MNDNTSRKALIAITTGMVEAGLEILQEHLNASDEETEDRTDSQLVITLFTRMWQAVRRGKMPKSLIPVRNSLIMPLPTKN